MKTKTSIVITLLLLSSCKKEEICNCGTVISDNASNYSVVIENDCSGNQKEFILSSGDWMNAHPGQSYCITNVDKW